MLIKYNRNYVSINQSMQGHVNNSIKQNYSL